MKFKAKKLRDYLPTFPNSMREWFVFIFVTGSVIYAIGFLIFLLFFWEASHPFGFKVNGENL